MGQLIPPTLAALTALEQALQTELYAVEEAYRDTLQRDITLPCSPAHVLVLVPFIVMLDLL